MVSGTNRKTSFTQAIKSSTTSLENNFKINDLNNQIAFNQEENVTEVNINNHENC